MRFIPSLFILSAALLFAAPALATPPGVVGQRNFQRGLRAEWANKDAARAKEYYTTAAKAFRELMEENRKDGTSTRTSRLVMAGICQFKAGMYADAAATMQVAGAMDAHIWEAWLYGGLAKAMQDDAEGALNMWKRFPQNAFQRKLNPVIGAQVAALEAGETTPRDAAEAVLKAEAEQFRWNYYSPGGRNNLAPPDQCDGRFWWRYFFEPCELNALD
ncbi:hypothetical protein [Salidesulfovibrio onnuriiensis]|uniref:hypothetical protein n=1 Tax=Salidesulfovibrio onnuriiensis TaxID=2583823 RepID=UPI0011C9E0C3|nr:hypothetical protein [Salidesulfovibrio onnuriiensis]